MVCHVLWLHSSKLASLRNANMLSSTTPTFQKKEGRVHVILEEKLVLVFLLVGLLLLILLLILLLMLLLLILLLLLRWWLKEFDLGQLDDHVLLIRFGTGLASKVRLLVNPNGYCSQRRKEDFFSLFQDLFFAIVHQVDPRASPQQERKVRGRGGVEFNLETVGMNPDGIDLEAVGSIDENDCILLVLVQLDGDSNRPSPPKDELLSVRRLIFDGVPELGYPREFHLGLVNIQEIDRWIDDSVEGAVVGGTCCEPNAITQ